MIQGYFQNISHTWNTLSQVTFSRETWETSRTYQSNTMKDTTALREVIGASPMKVILDMLSVIHICAQRVKLV